MFIKNHCEKVCVKNNESNALFGFGFYEYYNRRKQVAQINSTKILDRESDIIILLCQQLRYLQTLNNICGEKNSTVILPLPIEFLTPLLTPTLRTYQQTATESLLKAEDK